MKKVLILGGKISPDWVEQVPDLTKVTVLKVLSFRKFGHESVRNSLRLIMQDYSWQCTNEEYWNGDGAV